MFKGELSDSVVGIKETKLWIFFGNIRKVLWKRWFLFGFWRLRRYLIGKG